MHIANCYTWLLLCAMWSIGRHEVPYWSVYSKPRMLLYSITVSKYFDLAIAGVIGLNVITMALEFYLMPKVAQLIGHLLSLYREHCAQCQAPVFRLLRGQF